VENQKFKVEVTCFAGLEGKASLRLALQVRNKSLALGGGGTVKHVSKQYAS
jgi:hypothetical protein